MLVPMTVLRDGYWDGQYPRAGETITVDPALVDTFERAGFAMRQAPDQPTPTKGSHAHDTPNETRRTRGR